MIDTISLRKKIIELALQGLLVSSNEKGDNIEELLETISAKREEYIKAGRIKKKKVVSAIKEDELLFPVPDNWGVKKLGEISLPISDGIHYAPPYLEDGYPCFSAKDIYNDEIHLDDCTYISLEEYIAMKDKINVNEGCILITKSGSIGRSAIVNEYFEFGLVESIGVINPIIVRSEYIKIVLDYGFVFSNRFVEKYTRGVGLKHLTLTLLENIPIPLPSLEIQTKIVDTINEVFKILDIIDELQSAYSSDIEVLKSKLIDAGIQGKLTEQLPEDGTAEELLKQIAEEKKQLVKEKKIKVTKVLPEISEDEIPFNIPNNWKFVRLGEVLNEIIVPQRDKPKVFDGDIPWCRIEDAEGIYLRRSLSNQNVSQATVDKMNLRVCPKGTILSACSGASIGRILITESELCTNQTFNGLVCSSGLFNKYLYYYMNHMIDKLRKMGTGAAMAYISQDKTAKMVIPFPPYDEQVRIVDKIDRIMDLI